MPTTLIGLLIFVVLLMPGFAYTMRRERNTKAERRLSVFRETVAIAFSSVFANFVVIALFYVFSRIFPRATPDIDSLLRTPGAYFRENYWDLLGWASVLLVVATVGAVLAASPKVTDLIRSPFLSGWKIMFAQHDKQDVDVYVGCTMSDGSYVGGYLFSSSRLSDDSPDRDITLTGEISYRAAGAEEQVVLPDTGGVILSARNIMMMTVSYIPRDEDNDPSVATQEYDGKSDS